MGAMISAQRPASYQPISDALRRPVRAAALGSLQRGTPVPYVTAGNAAAAIQFALDSPLVARRTVLNVVDDLSRADAASARADVDYTALQDTVRTMAGLPALWRLPLPAAVVHCTARMLGRPHPGAVVQLLGAAGRRVRPPGRAGRRDRPHRRQPRPRPSPRRGRRRHRCRGWRAVRVLTVVMMADARRGGGLAERAYQLTRACARAGGPDVRAELLTLDLDLTDTRIGSLVPAALTTVPCPNRRFYVPARPGRVAERVAAADVVHLFGHWTALGALGYRAARRRGIPWVVSPCGSLPVDGRSRAAKRPYSLAVGARIVREAAAAIAVTADEAADFGRYGRDPAAVRVIPNGVSAHDHERDAGGAFLRRHGLADRRYLLFLGRLNRIKGVDLLVEAFAASSAATDGWLLVLAGPDEGLAAELRAQASALGVADAVRFVGVVAGAERTEALRAASLVVPSRREAMSIVALEAGVNGTPVLITDTCGFDEVAHCGGGLVVAATAPALAAGLHQLLARPDTLAERGARLRAMVLAELTWERAATRHLEVFADVAAATRAATELVGRGAHPCG